MNRTAKIAVLLGLVLAGTLIATSDLAEIARALWQAGWGILLVIALHLPQTFLSALGLGSLLAPEDRPSWRRLYLFRWVREAVNSLLPVTVGGDAVRARMQILHGTPPITAVAVNVVDVSSEMMTQAFFTLSGVVLMLTLPGTTATAPLAWGLLAASTGLAVLLLGAQRLGIVRVAERALARIAASSGAARVDMTGLHETVVALYRNRRRVFASGGYHLASWMVGTLETYAALAVLGLDPTLSEALVIEALGQAARSAGFLIPGGLGVQEGAYVLIGSAFGISAESALALSLVRRLRELALGLPGLLIWYRAEGRDARGSTMWKAVS